MIGAAKKNSFLFNAFLISLFFHLSWLFIFGVTIPTQNISFKPELNFLGAIFKSKDMFVSRVSPALEGEPKASNLTSTLIKGGSVEGQFFNLNKPKKLRAKENIKEPSKTIFPQPEPANIHQDEFVPVEKFLLKPLRLESHDKN